MQKRIVFLMLLTIFAFSLSTNILAQTRQSEREDHPRIAAALNALNGARAELKAAPHDFGGHKAEAIQACDRATQQLKYALSYRAKEDRRRGMLDPSLSDSLREVSYQNRETERDAHPRIATAIGALKEARAELEAAPHDFGGHKGAAISSVDEAIKQLQFALDFRATEDHKHRK
jgi:hypothetical protein